jgi:ribosomal protein L37AE/L43A
MYGRHGADQLSIFLLGLYLVLYFLAGLVGVDPMRWAGLVFLALAAFRTLSRNHEKRRAENSRFMALAGPVLQWFKYRRTIHKDKEHRYFKCPNCGQQLRAPRGKGRIHVTCRSCGVTFEENT